MITNRSAEYLSGLVHELRSLPHETEWVEFKKSYANPEMIGEDIAALSNGAALHSREKAYMLWGVEDETHVVVGTDFVPGSAKGKGNSLLEPWLLAKLRPQVNFGFHIAEVDGQRVVILEIEPATQHPVAFEGERFIRVGSATKKLKDHPEKERALWRILERVNFESGVAAERISDQETLDQLNYQAFFGLLGWPVPANPGGILETMERDDLIARCDAGGWNITNLGAILFANNLGNFRNLRRKAVRVVQYAGSDPTEILSARDGEFGYAIGFENVVRYINHKISSQVIRLALRRTTPMVPELTVRELVANALIHQDFLATGTGPLVEIFDSRIEITNPGEPLVAPHLFLGDRPTSRNEALAHLARHIGMCEELGSGIPRVVSALEEARLPAPLFDSRGGSTWAILFAHKDLSDMDREERVRTCYLHACLRYRQHLPMNNTSLRERFGIPDDRNDIASRLLREAVEDGAIVVRDASVGTRIRTYLPFWAG